MTADPAPGRLVAGKYRLLERVGTGGMSEVYRAETLDGSRTVAVKLLLPHKTDDPTFAARLFLEAQSGFRINHPGIVTVHDSGQSTLGPYLVMDYLVGESVGRCLFENGRFPLAAALATMLPVLDALGAAHRAGVVHRDIKPGNIFFAFEEDEIEIKLLDFGVAKALWPSGAGPRTSTGVVMGTPDYLSPEQANGEQAIDQRSDVFAVGVVLFELLTTRRPFHAPTAVATAYKVAHSRTPLLSEAGGPSDPTLQAILERALAKRADERYATARELADDLSRLAGSISERRQALHELLRPEQLRQRRHKSGERPISTPPGTRRDSVDPAVAFNAPMESGPIAARSRPLPTPTHSSGKPEARGAVLRAIDLYTQQVFGTEARRRVLDSLSKTEAIEFEEGTHQAIVLYDLEILNRYTRAVTQGPAMTNVGWARTAGAAAVGSELGALLRSALRPGDAPTVLRRLVPVLSRLFSFGSWELEPTPSLCVVRVSDIEALNAPIRQWLVGVIEGSLAMAGVRARSTLARGDLAWAPQMIVDIVS
ncbi:MAG: serine/threonine protein kinase [Myxococcales bacterium]|nr:serine/threonine protein kinase [Myxococcales bacterium]